MKKPWEFLFRGFAKRPMTCSEVGERLQHYLDGELDERRAARLVAHLEDCRRCGLEVETYERIRHSLAGRQSPVPADSLARLREFAERIVRGQEPVEL